eukprot:CAMPEP_0113274282 /NCGR_PEP_ID=MMETSP0008_2-20120614/24317_1 /TAXON_ID=97485 /ORGANISM="Prymnesium parvum" /LENGTH=165 /DNA_ID=CAMNT_0000123887 /DNA_START=9 /DNA_END=503 /DNA_ORIENTATION=+ /assembly_acc=CAM_ASM_000153
MAGVSEAASEELSNWRPLDSSASEFTSAARWAFAHILSSQWPRNGLAEQRMRGLTLIKPVQETRLPMAFVLLQEGSSSPAAVIGGAVLRDLRTYVSAREFARLQACERACLALSVVVEQNWQGLGHGRAVVSHLEASARERGCTIMYLFSVQHGAHGAHALTASA